MRTLKKSTHRHVLLTCFLKVSILTWRLCFFLHGFLFFFCLHTQIMVTRCLICPPQPIVMHLYRVVTQAHLNSHDRRLILLTHLVWSDKRRVQHWSNDTNLTQGFGLKKAVERGRTRAKKERLRESKRWRERERETISSYSPLLPTPPSPSITSLYSRERPPTPREDSIHTAATHTHTK